MSLAASSFRPEVAAKMRPRAGDWAFEPVFEAKMPETICVSPAPPFHPRFKLQTMPLAEFARAENINWTEAPRMEYDLRAQLYRQPLPQLSQIDFIEALCENPRTDLMLCDINPQIGKGVFVKPDAQPIPPLTPLFIYSGNIQDSVVNLANTHLLDNVYTRTLSDKEFIDCITQNSFLRPGISALKYRNLGAYVKYAPSTDALGKLNGDLRIMKEIATENILSWQFCHKGIPVTILFSGRTIYPGEQLLEHDQNLAETPKSTVLFNTKAEILGYLREDMIIVADGYQIGSSRRAHRARAEAVDPALGFQFIVSPSRDSYDKTKTFIRDVLHAIKIAKHRAIKDSPEDLFLTKFQMLFTAKLPDCVAAFKAIMPMLQLDSPEFLEVATRLEAFRTEISYCQKTYALRKFTAKPAPVQDASPRLNRS